MIIPPRTRRSPNPVNQFPVLPGNSFRFARKFNSFSGLIDETRNHGSKHGYPASAKAAVPQGINDQFSVGFTLDIRVKTSLFKSINIG